MFVLPTAADFKEWQIWHYQQRLHAATSIDAITFLEKQLRNFIASNAPAISIGKGNFSTN